MLLGEENERSKARRQSFQTGLSFGIDSSELCCDCGSMVPNNPSPPSSPPPPLSSPTPTPAPVPPAGKGHRWFLYGCGGFVALLLAVIATVLIMIWWSQRPIKPVVLSQQEKATVEQKLERINAGSSTAQSSVRRTPANAPQTSATTPEAPEATSQTPATTSQRPATTSQIPANTPLKDRPAGSDINITLDQPYVPGSKVLRITEREINGLLNANTDLGQSVRLEFARDAINAYVVVPIPQDVPVMGGKMFRARGRFRISIENGGKPYAILEDVTVYGLSLPKAWLGGIKGENLLENAVGERNGSPVLKGIKSLKIEPGALVLEVED